MAQKFNWCNVNWVCEMEGGRIIHPNYPYFYYDQSMIEVHEDNSLSLGIHNKFKQVKYWDGTIYNPSIGCGLIRSVTDFTYGTFTAEIQLPQGKNLWPAFWLCGVGKWPDHGEIDICEAYCNKRGSYFKPILPRWNTTCNVHYLDTIHKQCGAKGVSIFKQPKNPSTHFIKYQCEYRPNKITILVNDKVIMTYGWNITKHFVNSNMKVIFNLAPINEQYSCTNEMIIKYFNYKPL